MKALLIVLGVLLLLLILLILPVTIDFFYEKSFVYRIKYAGIVCLGSKNKTKEKTDVDTSIKQKQPKPNKDNFFKKTYNEKGFYGTVEYFCKLLMMIFKKLSFIIKHLKIRRFKLDLTVASSDAADTALQYGGICSAVYPIIAFLQTNVNFKFKNVNIRTDFDKTKPEFKLEFFVITKPIYLLLAVLAALFEFLKLQRKEREKNERKQH